MKPKTFILFGRAGSGKGTQSEQLTKYLQSVDPVNKVVYVETGERLREFIKQGKYSHKIIADVMAHGGLLPPFIPIWIWTSAFFDNFEGHEHVVLDGLSRQPNEAPILADALQFYKREDPHVLVLNVSVEECKRRLMARNRSDDLEEKINNRLAWYESNVVPTVDYFRKHPYFKVIDINGEQSVEDVHRDIVAATA